MSLENISSENISLKNEKQLNLTCQILFDTFKTFQEVAQKKEFDNLEKIILETDQGEVTILPNHCDFVAIIRSCTIFQFKPKAKKNFSKIEDDLMSLDDKLENKNEISNELLEFFNKLDENYIKYSAQLNDNSDIIEIKLNFKEAICVINDNCARINVLL